MVIKWWKIIWKKRNFFVVEKINLTKTFAACKWNKWSEKCESNNEVFFLDIKTTQIKMKEKKKTHTIVCCRFC